MKRFEKAIAVGLQILSGATCALSGALMMGDDVYVFLLAPGAVLGAAGMILWGRSTTAITGESGAEPKLTGGATLELEDTIASLQRDVAALRDEREFLQALYSAEGGHDRTPSVPGGGAGR